jgi:ribulose-5-phosphate 4-epimerase/fuculose-1-phosphate aldolase
MEGLLQELFYYVGKIGERLAAIEAAAGSSGNISLRADRLPLDEFQQFGSQPRRRYALGRDFPGLFKRRFIITGSGKNLRYIGERPADCLALVEMAVEGYIILWGLKAGERITSECIAHFATYQNRPGVSAIIHAQPRSINVLTRLFRDEESLNDIMFIQHEQIQCCSPTGMGLVTKGRHGSFELADRVADKLMKSNICAVARHGTFSVGEGDAVQALNGACDIQEYYHDAAMTFLANPWLRLLPFDFFVKNLMRLSHIRLGAPIVNRILRPME